MKILGRDPAPTSRRARLTRPRAITGSASRAVSKPGDLRRLHQGWQPRALGYYDTVPECNYPAQFYARSMERIRFFPALLNDQGEPEEVEDGPLLELFSRIRDGSGSMSELAGSYGRLMFLIGDGYLTVSETDEEEVWEYLSPLELRVQPASGRDTPQEYKRLRAPGATPEELTEAPDSEFSGLSGNDVRVWRLWRRHPTYSQWSDSSVRSVLELYELLVRLTLASGSESGSRAAQRGGLFIPDEITVEQVNSADEEDPEQDLVIARIIDGYTRSIQNPGSVEAMMPFIFRGPAALQTTNGTIATKEAMGWFQLGPSDRYLEGEMWEKTIDRIANGLDMPREMINAQGVGGVNHWTGWLLDEQGFRQHIAPVVVRFCNDLTSAYLRPAAKEDNFGQWARATIGFDPAEAINHPDEIGTAKDAHDRLVVSDAYYLDKIGATEADAPDEEELARRTLILLKQVPPEVAAEEGETAPDAGGRGGDTVEEPPAQPAETAPVVEALPASARALQTAKILGAAELAVERARELAGNRIARRSQSCPECMERIHGVPRALVASVLGADQVRSVLDGHGAEDELVAGAGKVLADRLVAWGINGGWPDKLGEMVEQHALKTLYDPETPGLPAGFEAACAKATQ